MRGLCFPFCALLFLWTSVAVADNILRRISPVRLALGDGYLHGFDLCETCLTVESSVLKDDLLVVCSLDHRLRESAMALKSRISCTILFLIILKLAAVTQHQRTIKGLKQPWILRSKDYILVSMTTQGLLKYSPCLFLERENIRRGREL